jgi:hypothetical protein
MPNFIDLIASFPNDAPNKFVGNVNLLCLQLLRWVVGRRWEIVARHITTAWDIGGTTSWRSSRAARPITRVAGVRMSGHFFLGLNQNVADVVGCNVDSIRDTCYTQDSLKV